MREVMRRLLSTLPRKMLISKSGRNQGSRLLMMRAKFTMCSSEVLQQHKERVRMSWILMVGAFVVGAEIQSSAEGLAESPYQHQKFFTPKERIQDRYHIGKELGRGAFGTVSAGIDKYTSEHVAVKTIRKSTTVRNLLRREIDALLHIDGAGGHENIIRLRGVYEDHNHVYIVTELVEGGELFDHLVSHGPYSEAIASRFIKQVAEALNFLHSHNLAHKDLKPENLMLSKADDDAPDNKVKLVDFGSAGPSRSMHHDARQECIGTMGYMSPEMITGNNAGPTADMWALGCILYILLSGMHPFDPDGKLSDVQITERVLEEPLSFNYPVFNTVSNSAKDLILKLTDKNPQRRMTSRDMLVHPWVKGTTASDALLKDSDKKLERYTDMRRQLKMSILGVVIAKNLRTSGAESSQNNSSPDGSHFRQRLSDAQRLAISNAFRLFDKDNRGYIPFSELQRMFSDVGELLTEADVDGILSKPCGDKSRPRGLYYDDFMRIMSELTRMQCKKGTILFQQGDPAEDFFLVERGKVKIAARGISTPLAILGPGEFFGENALMHNRRRNATVECVTDVTLIKMNRDDFATLVKSRETTQALQNENMRRNMERTKLLMKMAGQIQEVAAKRGDVIIKEGDEGDSMYSILEGEVTVYRNHLWRRREVARLSSGEVFGETALLTKNSRNATVLCSSETCLFSKLVAKDFQELLQTSEEVRDSLNFIVARRNEANTKQG